ncbi:MAG TPA: PAS domain-containing protein, partial [Vicinamibacteria bacterium]
MVSTPSARRIIGAESRGRECRVDWLGRCGPQRGGLVSHVVKDLVSRVQGTGEPLTLNPSADQLRGFIDSIPTLAWSAASDGAAESFNQRWLDYTGLSASEGLGWGWKAAIHPDDLPRLL